MSVWSRVSMIFHAKTNAALDQVEDPREILAYAHDQQARLLRTVKAALIDVATSKVQLRQQSERLRSRIPLLEDQARRAVAEGRDDLARMALQKKQTALGELTSLDRQLEEVAAEERKLTTAQQQLASRVEAFRIRRDGMTARYTAAEAYARTNEALLGVSGDLAELSLAVGRAEEKTERMAARASALDALIESGTLAPATGDVDPVEAELRRLAATRAVDEELDQIKKAGGPASGEVRP